MPLPWYANLHGNIIINGHYLFQALHKITLRESICTIRVCDVILQLVSTLIDLGLLAKKTASTSTTSNPPSNKEAGQAENR